MSEHLFDFWSSKLGARLFRQTIKKFNFILQPSFVDQHNKCSLTFLPQVSTLFGRMG